MAPSGHPLRSRSAPPGMGRMSVDPAFGPELKCRTALVTLARLLGRQTAREQLSATESIDFRHRLDSETSPSKVRTRAR